MAVRSLIFILFALLFGCTEEVNDPVRVKTSGIYDPVRITLDGTNLSSNIDLDEFVKGGDPRYIEVKIENHSGYPVLDISLEALDNEVDNYDFAQNELGRKEFPGFGGDCPTDILPSGQSCKIVLQFTSLVTGQISQQFRLQFKNIVEPGDESFSLTVFSGDPASLVFVPDTLNYYFGDLTGAAQIPLVERDERLVRTKTLTISNAGELRGRNLIESLTQGCASKLDGNCPAGQEDAYKALGYNCPKELRRGESCQVTIEYTNKNQGSDPYLKDVSYDSTFTIGYKRDPHGSVSALNAYFDSTSANIEAYFESSLGTLDFEDPVVSGNRSKKSFRIKNTGYREGYLRRLMIYEDGSTDLAFYCQKGNDAILECFTPDDQRASLEKFPLFFVDTQSCMVPAMNQDFPIDTNCIFDMVFQPSANYIVDGSFNYDIKFEYDTRWLGLENITESPLVQLNTRGEWKSPARLVWQDILVEGVGSVALPFQNTVKVEGLGANLNLSAGAFYTLGKTGMADIPLLHQDFSEACEPLYDIEGEEVGTLVTFTNTVSGTVSGRIYENYQGQGKGIVIEAGGSGTIQNGTVLDFKNCEAIKWSDLGRLAMELWEYYETEKIQFRYKNIGGVAAQNVQLVDGDGVNIPAGISVNLGDGPNTCSSADSDACHFYQSVNSSCSIVQPSTPTAEFPCTIAFDFAPIKRQNDDETNSNDSMFDYIGSNVYENYKSFKLSYENGAKYEDTNLTVDSQDIPAQEIEARLHGVLVNKGLLSKLSVDSSPSGGSIVGEYNFQTLAFRNIGTGSIPYFHDNGTNLTENMVAVPTTGLLAGEADCNDLIDWNNGGTGTSLGSLASGQVCKLTLRYEALNKDKMAAGSIYTTGYMEINRLFNRGFSSDELWEFGSTPGTQPRINLMYYDGDVSNESKSGAYAAAFGDEQVVDENGDGFGFRLPPHFTPVSPQPLVGAIMMRPSFTKNDLYQGGTFLQSGHVVPRTWFYGYDNYDLYETSAVQRDADDQQDALFTFNGIKRGKSVLPASCSDCDYYIHFGTFRSGQTHDLTFNLANLGEGFARVLDLDLASGGSPLFAIAAASQLSNHGFAGGSGAPINLTFTPAAGDAGLYSAVIEFNVDSQIAANKISAPNKIWTYKIEIVAEAINNYPNLSFNYQKYQVTTQEGVAPTELLEGATYSVNPSYDLDLTVNPATNHIPLEMVQRENPQDQIDAGYVKRRLNVTRQNQDINNLKVFLKLNGAATTTAKISNYAGLSWANTCEGATLTTGSPSCHIDIKYQPNQFSTTSFFVLTFAYEIAPNQFTYQNVPVQITPKTPGTLLPLENQYKQTFGGLDALNDPDAMALDFGTAVYDVPNKTVKFNDIVISNSSPDIRASFLKAYQLKNMISNPSVYPGAGEWVDISGRNYVSIYETKYPNSTDRVTVMASEECIYGEILPGDGTFDSYEHNERGFLGGGYAGCSLQVTLRMDANYINQSLNNREPASVMADNYFQLFYYSFDRVEDSYLSFYFKGQVDPDSYTKVSDIYDVGAEDSKTISFTFDDVTENNPAVGTLAGYRVFYSETLSGLDNVLLDGGLYLTGDVAASGVNSITLDPTTMPIISRGKAFYFKIFAIRQNAGYTAGGFDGLPAGYYLSEGDIPILRVVVPKFDHTYVHEISAMVKKDGERESGSLKGPLDFAGAKSACSSLSGVNIDDPSSSKGLRPYRLINQPIWDEIVLDPSMSNYAGGENPLSVPHWLDAGTYDIYSIFNGLPGYNDLETFQTFDPEELFYFRCTDACANDRMMGGGFYGQSFQAYTLYVGETVTLGHARCYIDVSF